MAKVVKGTFGSRPIPGKQKASKIFAGAKSIVQKAGIPKICIQFSDGTLNAILNETPPDANYRLKGVQFEFNSVSNNISSPLPKITISQIYQGLDHYNLVRKSIITDFPKPGDQVFEIHEAGSNHLSQLNPPASQTSHLYTRFHSYQPDVDLVYFGIGDFLYLSTYFKHLRLSGIETQLQSDTNSSIAGKRYSNIPLFSLKLEGVDFKNLIPSNISSEAVAGLFTGITCPPIWYAAGQVFVKTLPKQIRDKDIAKRFIKSWMTMNGYHLT